MRLVRDFRRLTVLISSHGKRRLLFVEIGVIVEDIFPSEDGVTLTKKEPGSDKLVACFRKIRISHEYPVHLDAFALVDAFTPIALTVQGKGSAEYALIGVIGFRLIGARGMT